MKKSNLLSLAFILTLSFSLASCNPSSESNSSSNSEKMSSSSSTSVSQSSNSQSETKITKINYFGEDITLDEHHILVDSSLESNKLNNFVYNDLVEASKHLVAGASYDEPTIIYLAKGVYWVDDKNAEEDTIGSNMHGLELKQDFVRIYGLDKDASKTIIAGNRGNREGSTGNWNVMGVSNGFVAKDLTIGNYVNLDLVYPDNPSLNVPARNSTSITQGQTVSNIGTNSDKWQFNNVRFISRLNCIPGGADRFYFKDCHIECTDDAIQPGNHVVYENCDFDFYGKHPMWGSNSQNIAFLGCTFRGKGDANSKFYFSKDPTNLALIDCKFEDDFEGGITWCNTLDRHPEVKNYVYNSTYKDLDVVIGADGFNNTITLKETDVALKAFKVGDTYNSYNLLKGNDNWDPNNVKDLVSNNIDLPYRATLEVKNGLLGADGKLVEGQQTTLVPTFISSSTDLTNVKYKVELAENSNFTCTINEDNTLNVKVKDKIGLEEVTDYVEIQSESNLHAVMYFNLTPAKRTAPTLESGASLEISDGKANLNYSLDFNNEDLKDNSLIEFYRSNDNKLDNDDVKVATTRLNKPFKSYTLTNGDIGKYIIATIATKSNLSDLNSEVKTFVTNSTITNEQVTSSSTILDFNSLENIASSNKVVSEDSFMFDTHIPADLQSVYYPNNADGSENKNFVQYKQQVEDSKTSFPDGFEYTEGADGALGKYGFSQKGRGARMLYTPISSNQNKAMDLTMRLNPAKSAGQGFGSAHGQYLDIYIGYDTTTLSGYGLRIEREKAYSNACLFGLYKFNNDKAEYISKVKTTVNDVEYKGLFAAAYKGNVDVSISLTDTKLTASIVSDKEKDPTITDSDHEMSVTLEADITNGLQNKGGIGFINTGTTSVGNRTTISNFKIEYK